ncbi:MAG: hypothetical protein BJ554DRAFT_8362, partial [Olpidium bornovanus]
MKLSASLLALVAALLVVVADVPPVGSAFSPASHGGPDPASPGYWSRVLLGAIREHIDLAKLTVNFIAKNFENPPHPGSDRMRAANPEFTILAPGYIHFVDRRNGFLSADLRDDRQAVLNLLRRGELALGYEFFAVDSLRRLTSLISSNNAGDIIQLDVQAPLQFNMKNFETNGDMENFETDGDVHVHVLRDGAQARVERLWGFYRVIRDQVFAGVPASDNVSEYHRGIVHRLPMPDILRPAGSGRRNRQAQLTNEAVRELLFSAADELSRCLSELYNAQSVVDFPGDFFDLLYRLNSLEEAISKIRIYDNDP